MPIEYRDDDIVDQGWCPVCGRHLYGVLRNGKGFCEEHKWVWVEWNPPANAKEEEDDE